MNNVMRGNPYKLSVNNCRINVRQYYFAQRVASVWNSLSPSVVDFSSSSAFKKDDSVHVCCIVHILVAVRPFVYAFTK